MRYGDTAPKYADKKESPRSEQVEINLRGPAIDLSKCVWQTASSWVQGVDLGVVTKFTVKTNNKQTATTTITKQVQK